MFALDFVAVDEKARAWKGDGRKNEQYFGWNQPVFAVAPGIVEEAAGNNPDEAPWDADASSATINRVSLHHEDGTKSYYVHFREGTLVVRRGERVKAGQLLGRIGNSGNRSYPHLHFAVYERFQGDKGESYLSVPFAAEGFSVVRRVERQPPGEALSFRFQCDRARLQEGWVVEAPKR